MGIVQSGAGESSLRWESQKLLDRTHYFGLYVAVNLRLACIQRPILQALRTTESSTSHVGPKSILVINGNGNMSRLRPPRFLSPYATIRTKRAAIIDHHIMEMNQQADNRGGHLLARRSMSVEDGATLGDLADFTNSEPRLVRAPSLETPRRLSTNICKRQSSRYCLDIDCFLFIHVAVTRTGGRSESQHTRHNDSIETSTNNMDMKSGMN